MLTLFIRCVFIYIILTVFLRFTGKRQIGELQISELICALLLSELAAEPILNNNIPILHAVIPIATLVALEVISSFIVTKSTAMKRALDGTPNILIRDGIPDQHALLNVRLSMEELLAQLRLKGYSDVGEIAYAILEHNGQLSVLPKAGAKPPNAEDFSLQVPEKGMAHALVVDGVISRSGLALTGKSEKWVLDRIAGKHCGIADIFLYSLDDAGNECWVRKEKT